MPLRLLVPRPISFLKMHLRAYIVPPALYRMTATECSTGDKVLLVQPEFPALRNLSGNQ
jgi:hypothetical protein